MGKQLCLGLIWGFIVVLVFGKPRYEPIVSLSERSLATSEFERAAHDFSASQSPEMANGSLKLSPQT